MNTPAPEAQEFSLAKNVGIRRIYVERLFGQYTYDLCQKDLPSNSAAKLLMLYGDNGSGKTTILRMLFFLLSPVDGQGHKTAVSRILFQRFEVHFADGTTVSAERDQVQVGPYELRVIKDGQTVAQYVYAVKEDEQEEFRRVGSTLNKINRIFRPLTERAAREHEHEKMLKALAELNPGAIYVSDDRRVLNTIEQTGVAAGSGVDSRLLLRMRKGEESERSALSAAVAEISSWATRRAFRGAAQGEEDVNSAYAAIVKRLALAPSYVREQHPSLQSVIEALQEQGRRSPDFVRFGLMKPLLVDEIVDHLRAADTQVRDTMLAVLEPYITSVKARLDALEPIRVQLAAFVDTMNSYYRNKSVHLDVDHGLTIRAATGDRLAPGVLSSGEGQLLFLFATTLLAKERASLFMIDEPELSLNVKWQRQLLSTLLKLTVDSNIQFVFATHSIELLTRYRQFVLDLTSVPENYAPAQA